MFMKILLINPPRTYYQGSKGIRIGLPLSLLYLAAILKKNGYQPRIFDCLVSSRSKIVVKGDKIIHGLPDDVILEIIRKENPCIVGITNPFTAQIENAIHIADLVKQVNKRTITVIGGPHTSVQSQELLKENRNIDIGVRGEGEYTFLELIKKIEKGLSIRDVANITYRDETQSIVENEFKGFIENLDELPYPVYQLFGMEEYFNSLKRGLGPRPIVRQRSISMITSRGCPYNCVFCSVHLHMGKFFRAHSSDYVIRHIKYVVDKYRVKHISFEDDNFSLNIDRCKKILKGIIDNRIKITWDTPNGIRADKLDEELIRLMKKSGCLELSFGIESGSQKVLDEIIDKNLKLDKVIKVIQLCQKYKIKTKAFFVIGFPGETRKDIIGTKELALKLYKKYKVDPGLSIAVPLFGTRLYQICKTKGYLIKEPDPMSLSIATQAYGQGLIKTEEFDPAYLKKIVLETSKARARIRLKEKLLRPGTYWSSFKFVALHPQMAIKYLREKLL